MATFNSGPILEQCLKSIRSQNYDQSQIEILAADGGSTDGTIERLKKYQATVVPENTGSPEAAKSYAVARAIGEIILMADTDVILPHPGWLKRMISYFDREPEVTGVYPWRYTWRRDDKPLNRYFALFGANDPVAYFLGRADRQSYHSNHYELAGDAKDKGDYFLVKFGTENLPTVGANGFLIRRELLLKAQVDEKHFYHIDVNWDLVNQGSNQYVIVKNDVIHATGERFWNFFRKRKRYMEELYLKDLDRRRYFIYKKERDRGRLFLYCLYAGTLIGPTLEAICGFLRIPDPAWFLHPSMCFGLLWIYATSTINWQLWHYLGLLQQKQPRMRRPIGWILRITGLAKKYRRE